MMKVLVVGSGGREHALAWRLGKDNVEVLVAPGKAGTPNRARINANEINELAELARRERIDLTVVGPEAPLALGIVDRFTELGLRIFGPTREAARLEWSKAWTKDFLRRHGIPGASSITLDSESATRRAIARTGLPVVLKADGLAGGKGVFVAHTAAELEDAVDQLWRRRTFGAAADQVVVEEHLEGPELSVLAFTDGERLAMLPPARDYKRRLEGDRGPNTGGMGGMTWPSYATRELMLDVEERILRPTLAGMQVEGCPYRGVLYAGLMLTADGPKVLEFNCRFGDPECQLILPLLASPLIEPLGAITEGALKAEEVRWMNDRTYGVVLATEGYPEAPRIGDVIEGLENVPAGVMAFHAGTRLQDGNVVTAGGRVLALVGPDREAVYRGAESIHFAGKQLRRDIGAELASAVAR
jgi:phosphoribosylamine--glycine ligase